MAALSANSVIHLIENLGSNSPVPGGGAVSALSASLALALTEMVDLQKGRKVIMRRMWKQEKD